MCSFVILFFCCCVFATFFNFLAKKQQHIFDCSKQNIELFYVMTQFLTRSVFFVVIDTPECIPPCVLALGQQTVVVQFVSKPACDELTSLSA